MTHSEYLPWCGIIFRYDVGTKPTEERDRQISYSIIKGSMYYGRCAHHMAGEYMAKIEKENNPPRIPDKSPFLAPSLVADLNLCL